MVSSKKRLSPGYDSNSDSQSSSLRRMRDDDVYSMVRKRKQLKMTTPSKRIWSKTDELVILGGIVDFQKEKEVSYNSDLDSFSCYIKPYIDANFSKQQLLNKIKNLKRRFRANLARSKGGKEPSFATTDDDDLFRLSVMIWAKSTNETECVSNESMEQAKVLFSNKDEPFEEPVQVSNTSKKVANSEKEKSIEEPCVLNKLASNTSKKIDNSEKEKSMADNVDEPCVLNRPASNVSKKIDNSDKEKSVANNVDEPCVLNRPASNASMKIDNSEKEKSMADNVEEPCVLHKPASNTSKKIDKSEEDVKEEPCLLQEALEEQKWFQSLGKYQQKLMLKNLKNLGSEIRKELTDEIKALLIEEVKLNISIQTFAAKLANEAASG